MFRNHIAYKHDKQGTAEGFIGYGFTPQGAADDAVRQIRAKLGDAFRPGRVVRDRKDLTAEEFQTVCEDWLGILRAKRRAGHSVI